MPTYSVKFINNSQNQGSACLFQQSSAPSYGQVFPLAWFAQRLFPGSQTTFQWTLDYSFVWAQTGTLQPGISFRAAEEVAANPSGANKVTFSQQFGPVQPGGQPGSLTIQTQASVQMNQYSVGIGMSGSATFATQAQPNMNNVFAANPEYWLPFGNYQEGQVLDPNNTGNAVRLDFGGGTSLSVTLNQNGTYTIQG